MSVYNIQFTFCVIATQVKLWTGLELRCVFAPQHLQRNNTVDYLESRRSTCALTCVVVECASLGQ